MMRSTVIVAVTAASIALVGTVASQVAVQAPPHPTAIAVGTDPAADIAALKRSVAALEASVAALQAKTQMLSTDGRNLTIKSPGDIKMYADRDMTIDVTSNTRFTSRGTLEMGSLSVLSLKAGGLASLTAGSNLGITAAMVRINANQGGNPAARVGSQVSGKGGGGQITTGSATVMIGN
jgi:hypothetical protein